MQQQVLTEVLFLVFFFGSNFLEHFSGFYTELHSGPIRLLLTYQMEMLTNDFHLKTTPELGCGLALRLLQEATQGKLAIIPEAESNLAN